MFGKNKKLKPVNIYQGTYEVKQIFLTLQGEGPYVGYPAIFIRLGGCNLACNFCDTDFDNPNILSLGDILTKIDSYSKDKNNKKLIVITGGEPFRQPIEPLCEELVSRGYMVQIETNGTIFRNVNKEVKIICSPKNTNNYGTIRNDLLPRINAFKFIISASNSKYSSIPEIKDLDKKQQIYIQPMDEYCETKNQQNIEYAIKLAQEKNYILSIQTHKIIGVE